MLVLGFDSFWMFEIIKYCNGLSSWFKILLRLFDNMILEFCQGSHHLKKLEAELSGWLMSCLDLSPYFNDVLIKSNLKFPENKGRESSEDMWEWLDMYIDFPLRCQLNSIVGLPKRKKRWCCLESSPSVISLTCQFWISPKVPVRSLAHSTVATVIIHCLLSCMVDTIICQPLFFWILIFCQKSKWIL